MASVDDVGAGAMCRWGYWLHSCTSHCLASMFIANLHATPITCQLCILQSLPPLQKQLELWGLAFLAGLHCSVGVVWVLAYLSTFDAIFASCCHTLACEPHQPTCFIPCHLCRSNLNSGDWRCLPICIAALALFGCQHCCHVGIMACHTHCL